ncbi:adenylyl cyclase-associated protein 1-like isoform X2 [Amphiura filiformis]|uniref:adenylyl cyclase-associated protein 1-like isoform X2 n=1 Tax=Amphiura filiformis TaxID=82378 RepID=UPI003B2244A5
MADLSALISQLNNVSIDLSKAVESVKLSDVTKDFTETLEGVITKLQGVSRDTGGGGAVFVQAFDEVINGSLAEFVRLSGEIGGNVKAQCDAVQEAFKAQKAFLGAVAEFKVPSPTVLQSLLKPTSDQISAVQEVRDKNRGDKEHFNHLTAISEGIPALGWVTVPARPGGYIKEMSNTAQFYTNRVLKEYKEKDKKHVDWSRAFLKLLSDLEAYVMQHHTTGVQWNSKGKDAVAAAPPPAPAGGAPPPPPPGPPPPPVEPAAGGGDDDKNRMAQAALFSEINRGEGVTSHLKKVTPDMQTHKNPTLRAAGAVGASAPKTLSGPKPYKAPTTTSKVSAPAAKKVAPKKTPKTELEGKKWAVEFHEGNRDLVVEGNMKQTVYIYQCKECTIQVKGKVNSITLDNCKKTAVVFEDVLGTVDFINCQSVQAQVTGKVPIVSIDKTDGFQMYFSKDSLECQVVSAKSSEMNISIPNADGEYSEYPVPEQYKTIWDGKKLVTECTESV